MRPVRARPNRAAGRGLPSHVSRRGRDDDAESPGSEADRLIARVLDAGGRLLLPDDPGVEEAHEHLVRASLDSPRRPKGKRLAMRGTGPWGDGPAEIVMVEHVAPFLDGRG